MKYFLRKRILCDILAVLLAGSVAGCGTGEKQTASQQQKDADIMKGTLSVYYVDYGQDNTPLKTLLSGLETYNHNLELKPTAFKNQDDFMKQVTTELGSGGGPDLFLLDYMTGMSFQKMSKNGTYLDLTPYLQADKTYRPADYYAAAIKAGKADGKQRALPIMFSGFSLLTSKEKMKAAGVSLTQKSTWKDVLQALAAALKKAGDNSNTMPVFPPTNRSDLPTMLVTGFGMQTVDVKNQKVVLNKDFCRAASDFSREWQPAFQKIRTQGKNMLTNTKAYSQTTYFLNNANYINSYYFVKQLDKILGQQTVSIPLTSSGQGKPTGELMYYAAINSDSKNKQLAYNAARSLMDMPLTLKDINGRSGFPVRKEVLKNLLDSGLYANFSIPIDGQSVRFRFDDKTNREIMDTVEQIQDIALEDYSLNGIIQDGFGDYVKGYTSDFDSCWNKTVNKLQLYANE